MKRYLVWLASLIIFLNGWSADEVSAQVKKAVNVEVKFDFRAGDKIYPAGIYRFESVNQNSDNMLHLRNVEKEKQQLIIANLSYIPKNQQPKLVFRQIGDEYFLTKIFLTDGNWGYSLRSSPELKAAEKKSVLAKTIELPVQNKRK